jgi:pyruvate dehydrogenase E2 component (dihydrolipoamide acetyltransferase)
MPALSTSMAEGKIARWLKREGEVVAKGEPIAEIETDKAVLELEATVAGTLLRILVNEGTQSVPVNHPIALLQEQGDQTRQDQRGTGHAGSAGNWTPRSAPGESAASRLDPASSDVRSRGQRILASPSARRLAAELQVDIDSIQGSGPGGRIVDADVRQALEHALAPAPAERAATFAQGQDRFRAVAHSQTRAVIARRMTEAKATIPHFYSTIDCHVEELLNIRERLNRQRPSDRRISLNDLIVRAAALTLRQHPGLNAAWTDAAMHVYDDVHIAVAVATPSGLVAPIIRNADGKSITTISDELRSLVERARRSQLLPEEYRGGTFTISNLGMYGIKQFDAIINAPQVAILAVGAAEARPVARGGKVMIANVMSCTLSCDHRAVDGAAAGEFLKTLRAMLQNPTAIDD